MLVLRLTPTSWTPWILPNAFFIWVLDSLLGIPDTLHNIEFILFTFPIYIKSVTSGQLFFSCLLSCTPILCSSMMPISAFLLGSIFLNSALLFSRSRILFLLLFNLVLLPFYSFAVLLSVFQNCLFSLPKNNCVVFMEKKCYNFTIRFNFNLYNSAQMIRRILP